MERPLITVINLIPKLTVNGPSPPVSDVPQPRIGGTIAHVKPAENPRWQTAKTPRQGFIMGGIWLFLALMNGVAAIGEPIGWPLVLGGLAALLGAGYVVTALLLRQRQRSGQ